MANLAKRIAESLGRELGSSQDQIAVMAYGLGAFFQMLSIGGVALLVGILGGFWPQSLLLFWAVGFMRSATGGAHAKSYGGCLVASAGAISIMAWLAHRLALLGAAGFPWLLALLPCAVVQYKKVPVETPNKPIRSSEKIGRLRLRALFIFAVYTAIAVVLFAISTWWPAAASLALALLFSVFWQSLMLTKTGAAFVCLVDKIFKM